MSRPQLQDAWQAMKILKRFSLQQVRSAIEHTTLDSLKAFAKRLVAAGAISEHVDYDDVTYTILNSEYNPFKQPANSGVANKNSGRQRMWQSMRILNEFDAGQVASTANVSLSSARAYISNLKKCGYIFVVQHAPRHGTVIDRAGESTLYKILKNTGPKRPIPKTNGLFDTNLNTLVKFKEVKRKTVQIAPVKLGEAHDIN